MIEVVVNFTIEDLAEPIIIHLPSSDGAETCKWWDEEADDWSAEGCVWVNGACACSHLTVFAAFLLFYECSTLSTIEEFPGFATMFGESFRVITLLPLALAEHDRRIPGFCDNV